MKKHQLFLSTIDPQAHILAEKYGIGLELAQFCTAFNIDSAFPETDRQIRQQLELASGCTFHGAFNELYPCAIDPKARELAGYRFRQALHLAEGYGAGKLILHGGFVPQQYHPSWYVEQSILFWQDFMKNADSNIIICLENVLEPEPQMLRDIVARVNDPRLRLCLDIGHANAYSKIPVKDWVDQWLPWLSHAHIHNNDGSADTHSDLHSGNMDIRALIDQMETGGNDITYTLELPKIGDAVLWLTEKELLIL